jgi:hypothetical protein
VPKPFAALELSHHSWRAHLPRALAGVALVATVLLGAATPVVASFTPSMGITRGQAESLFRAIDGKNTAFKVASMVKGVPRVLGGDQHLFTVVEINGDPEVVDVQVVTIIDTSSKAILENQVVYDSLACRVFATVAAENWCTSRVLNTNAKGMITATKTRNFGGLDITVRTYLSKKGSGPPIVSMDLHAE